MARRRFTLGRALALLILGICVGAGLFVAHHLRPDAIKKQVEEALHDFIQADFAFDKVVLDVDTGVEIRGLRINYDPQTPALTAERIALTIDHQELLLGEVSILQVDVYGLVARLKRDPARDDIPSLPGVFRQMEGVAATPRERPVIRVFPGEKGSRVELLEPRFLRPDLPVVLHCRHAEANPDGARYTLDAEFTGERAQSIALHVGYDPVAGRLGIDAKLRGLRLRKDDVERLSDVLREQMPPVVAAGVADVDVRARCGTRPFVPLSVTGEARLSGLEGAFGNLHTGDPAGFPFGLRGGQGLLTYEDGVIELKEMEADFVGPHGEQGRLTAELRVEEAQVDFKLTGSDLAASTADLRVLLPPDVVEQVVNQYLPSGTFDFELGLKRREGDPDKLWVSLNMRDGAFTYAGRLDELTGRRFGFRYPLDRCSGEITFETDVESPRGRCQLLKLRNVRGHSRIARPQPGGPQDVVAEAEGEVHMYLDDGEREDVRVKIRVSDLPIDAKLASAFASTPRGMPYHAFELSGWAKEVSILVVRDGYLDEEPRASYEVELSDCSMAYEGFPLHLVNLKGRIASSEEPPDKFGVARRVLRFEDFSGEARDGGTVHGHGYVAQRDDGTEELRLTIETSDLTIGPDLEQALQNSPVAETTILDLWGRLRPQGRLGARVQFLSPTDSRIAIHLDGQASLAGFDDIDCPVTDLHGSITYEQGLVLISDVRGRACGAPFQVSGAFHNQGEFRILGQINELQLGEPVRELLDSLAPGTAQALRGLQLTEDSALDIRVTVERPHADAELDVSAELKRLDLKSNLKGLPFSIQGGPVTVTPDSIHARDLWLKADEGEVRVQELDWPLDLGEGWAVFDAVNLDAVSHLSTLFGREIGEVLGHNLRADLKSFRVEYSRAARTVILSGAVDLRRHRLLDEAVDALEPTGALSLTPLTIRLPDEDGEPMMFAGVVEFRGLNMNLPLPLHDMNGELRIAEGTFSPFMVRGAISNGDLVLFDRSFDEIALNLSFDHQYLRLGAIDGRFYEGNLRGNVEVHLLDPGAFKVSLRAKEVALEEMLAEELARAEPMTGRVDIGIDFESASGEIPDMTGRGEIIVTEGRLFKVPGLRRVLAVVGRATPLSGPRFKQASMDFSIRGETLDVREIHLSTEVNDVYARGTVTIYGDLDLVVEPQVAKFIDLPRLINIPFLSALRDIWHKTAYEIRLEGTIDSPALRLRALPWLKRTSRPYTQSPHAGRAPRVRPRVLPQ